MKLRYKQNPVLKKGLLTLLVLLLGLNLQAQTKRYVKTSASGTGDGSTWLDASSDLQAMIDASASGDEVWVAAGTYKPSVYPTGCTTCSSNRDFTFFLKNGVKIYGGFVGTESALSQRNIVANVTLLSGDIGTANDNTDNCHHVVLSMSSTVTVDGFSIAKGIANGSGSILVNGIGIAKNGGGGIVFSGGTTTFTNNTVYDNTGSNNNGGLYGSGGTHTLTNNSFYNNTGNSGGAVFFTSSATATVTNNAFYNNTASIGGGVYVNANCSFINNTFYNNSASGIGGGLAIQGGTHSITNNLFWGNKLGSSSTNSGADFYRASGTATSTNNSMQLASSVYSGAPYTLGTASGNLFQQDPLFVNAADPDGADDQPRTADDGLVIGTSSTLKNAGTTTGAPTTDITSTTRSGNPDIGAYEAQVALSIELLSFEGQNTEGGNLLIWQTTNEVNNKGFEIEKKQGNTWQTLGFVAAKSKTLYYEFVDNSPLSTSYYRLKQLDNDGTFDYSKVIVIQKENKGVVKIYPSITKGQLTIEGATSFDIVNTIGQVVLSVGKVQTSNFNIQSLTNGIYLIRGLDTEGGHFLEKIVKQ